MNAPDRYERFVVPEGVNKVSYERDTKIINAASFTIEREDHTIGNILRISTATLMCCSPAISFLILSSTRSSFAFTLLASLPLPRLTIRPSTISTRNLTVSRVLSRLRSPGSLVTTDQCFLLNFVYLSMLHHSPLPVISCHVMSCRRTLCHLWVKTLMCLSMVVVCGICVCHHSL